MFRAEDVENLKAVKSFNCVLVNAFVKGLSVPTLHFFGYSTLISRTDPSYKSLFGVVRTLLMSDHCNFGLQKWIRLP